MSDVEHPPDPSESEEGLDEEPARPGPRQARRAKQRRRRRLQIVAAIAVVAMGAFGLNSLSQRAPAPNAPATPAPVVSDEPTQPPAVAEQDTLLLIRHGADEGPALGVTLLSAGEGPEANGVLFVPEATLVDIPGFGLDRLGLAYQYGGPALVEASVENLLAIDIDHVAAVSNSGLAAFLARTGGLDVDIDGQLILRNPDGSGEVRFEPGAQFLDGERLAELWAFRQRGESELDSFPRQQLVLGSLLQAVQDPEVLEALVSDGAPQLETSAPTSFLQTVLADMAAAQEAEELGYTLLPVTPFGAGEVAGDVTYRVVPEDVERLVTGPLRGSVPEGGGVEATRVQVLNGVGTPGVGQDVDRRLEGAGFRIVLTDNARNFDFAKTRILVYREDEASMEAAREVQERLGVGTIQISRQPQSVVDLTIVVGADFVETTAPARDPSPTPQEQSS